MEFKVYEKYLQIDIDYLEKIPLGWGIKRLKELCKISTGGTPSSSNPDYFIEEINWFTPSDFYQIPLLDSRRKISNLAIKDGQAKIFKKNSVLLVSIGATLGKTSYSEKAFSCNQQINSLIPNKKIYYKFLFYYLFSSSNLVKSYSLETTLAILNQDRSGLIPIFHPPMLDQNIIVDFLDKRVGLTDNKIKLLKKKKEKYQELRQTLINDAVTKGLDKNVELKKSEIEWIGKIPKHWEVERGKNLFLENPKSKVTANDGEKTGKYKFFTSSDNQTKWLNFFDMNSESILFSTGGSAGINYCKEKYSYSTDTWSICGNKKIYLKYYSYYFESIMRELKIIGFKGAGIEHLRKDFIKLGELLFPPKKEQIKIAEYLNEKTGRIGVIIKIIDRNIEALIEFRKTLINDVVIGKVNVV